MSTGGLVVVLSDTPSMWHDTMAQIAGAGVFEVGERFDNRLAVVLEAPTRAYADAWLTWLQTVPGVQGVEVVFVHGDDDVPSSEDVEHIHQSQKCPE